MKVQTLSLCLMLTAMSVAQAQPVSTMKTSPDAVMAPKPSAPKPESARKVAKAKPAARHTAKLNSSRVKISFEKPPTYKTAPQSKAKKELFARMAQPGRSLIPAPEATPQGKPLEGVSQMVPPAAPTPQPQVVINNTNNYQREEAPAPASRVMAPVASAFEDHPAIQNATVRYVRPRSPGHFVTLVPMGGLGYSQMDVYGESGVSGNQDITGRVGYQAGVLIDIGAGRFSFESGLVYVQEGATVQSYGNFSSGERYHIDSDISLHYIGIPLLAKLSSGVPGGTRFAVKAGVVPVYTTNADTASSATSVAADGSQATTYQNSSFNEGLRAVNVIAQAGAGLILPIDGMMDFRLDVVYSRGLLPIEASDDYRTKTYSQSVMALVGLGIGL